MANSWLRLWHDMPNDPKWRTIARKSEQSIALVSSVKKNISRGCLNLISSDVFVCGFKCRNNSRCIFNRNVERNVAVFGLCRIHLEEQQKSIAIRIMINRYLSFVLNSFNWKHRSHLNMLKDI